MKKNYFFFLAIGLCFMYSSHAQNNNYAEVLQKSMFFYECQESGSLLTDNRVSWRSNSALNDGSDVGLDLTGGWYDAGDHVKFNFPMAFTTTTLAWGAIDFKEGYESSNQMQYLKRNLRWVNDYFIKCHTAPNELYGQVGNGGTDHAWWGSAEVMKMDRPAYKIDASNPGSDLAAETAAAMAASSIVFADDDPTYSQTLLNHAIELYNFADNYRGKYSSSITDASSYYNSFSGYNDELVWGAIWLYRATNDATYLQKAEDYYVSLSTESQSSEKSYKWGLGWDDKSYGCYALLAKLTGKTQYITDIERHLDYWTTGYNGSKITYTPGGLAFLDVWGSLRYSANTSFVASYYADAASSSTKTTAYKEFAASQIDYILGNNPQNRSYVCGYGNNPPINPHHRTAHGCWSNNSSGPPEETRHTLYGALVGGPSSDDSYTDDRSNFTNNEVACDYNACFSGLLAYLVQQEGGTPLTSFPEIEVPTDEYFIEAEFNTEGTTFSEWAVWIYNHTAWPAREGGEYKFQLFIDISEGAAEGYNADEYVVSTNNSGVVEITQLLPWDESNFIYYAEVTVKSSIEIWPGGNSESKEEVQIRIRLPYEANASAWDPTNDWVSQNMDSSLKQINNIPLYVNGELVWGSTPTEAIPVSSISISSSAETLDTDDIVVLSTTVLPADASNKNVTWTSSDQSIASVTANGTVQALSPGTATITATSSDPSITATCQITVNEPPFVEVTGITLNPTVLTADINEVNSLSVTIMPADATDTSVTWSSSDSNIATVSASGVVTAIAEGEAILTATSSNTAIAAQCAISVTNNVVVPISYTLTISSTGLGTVSSNPEGDSFEENSEVTLTAIPDEGYVFTNWTGDITGTSATVTIAMDTDKTIVANFTESSGPCDNPTNISIPYTLNGTGELCLVSSDEITYVNSWNMEVVEINGTDYTNIWSSEIPDKIDGKYYIYLKGNLDWSHFEANSSQIKSISLDKANMESVKIVAFPNPFKESAELQLPKENDIVSITIIDQAGRCIQRIPQNQLQPNLKIGHMLHKGIYFIIVQSKNDKTVLKVVKE